MTSKESTPARAVAYLRVSTAGQADRGMGLAAQRDAVTECAQAQGLDLVEVVTEAASGGVRDGEEFSYEHRPVLLALVDRAERREFDVLLVAKLDRLSRDYATLTVLERRLQRFSVTVISTAEGNGDGAIAEFIRGQLALVAQLERAMILDRVRAGKAKRKAQGRHVHGRIPYGYVSAGQGVLEVDEARAEVVKRIFTDARGGYSPGRIARALNADGIVSPAGGSWGEMAVRRIVTNEVYAGERYGVKSAQPAIVSRRSWNAAGAALRARSVQPTAAS